MTGRIETSDDEERCAGHFEAHEVIAKCPSKYEAAEKAGYEHPLDVPRGSPQG